MNQHDRRDEEGTGETEEAFDFVLLCEQCPFAPKVDESLGQQRRPDPVQQQDQDERQMRLFFEEDFDTEEAPLSTPFHHENNPLQQMMMHWMQEQMKPENENEVSSQKQQDERQESALEKQRLEALTEEEISSESNDQTASLSGTAKASTDAIQNGASRPQQAHTNYPARRVPKQGQDRGR